MTATGVIKGEVLARRFMVHKKRSLATALWSPWLSTASDMDDLGADGWRDTLCVEPATRSGVP
jgi:D-hexose-6-phosphate mutarotase